MPRSKRPAGEGRLLQLVYYGYVAGSWLARALPERFVYAVAELAGRLKPRLSRAQARAVEGNLARVTGLPLGSAELQALVREAYASYARYWLETFRLVREGPGFFLERFLCDSVDNLDATVKRYGGAIVVGGHLANWDAGGAWVAARGGRLVTVAEVLKPRRMFDFFVTHRERLGMTIYPAERGVVTHLIEAVADGAVVAILGDRDLKGRGPEVDFFGQRVTMPGGPASLALRTGVPLLVVGVSEIMLPNGKRGWRAEISQPIPLPGDSRGAVAELTQEVAAHLEGLIARHPTSWHMMSPFWPQDRERTGPGQGGTGS